MCIRDSIGTVTTTFSVVDADLWKPLPYRHADRLVYAYSKGPDSQARWDAFSGADLLDWRAGATSFSQIAGTGRTARRVLHLQTAQSVVVHEVTANYFVTLGRDAIQGRTFSNNDSRGAIGPTVLTDRGWKRLFDSDPSVVGREMKLDDQSIQIAGVVPTDDSMGTAPDLYLAMDESSAGFLDRAATPINGIIGRLQQGATVESARAQLQAVEMRLATTYATPRARPIARFRSSPTTFTMLRSRTMSEAPRKK